MMSTAFDVSFAAVRPAKPTLSSPPEPSHGDAFVKLEKVALTYGRDEHRVHALDATDLSIEKGDFVALVGPSGCGKSTILKLVTGLLHATRGYVFVGGREVGAEPIRVGMAFQNPTLLPWLKLRENVMLPLKIVPPFRQDYRAKRKTEFRDRIEALLEQVGLKGFTTNIPGSCRAACCSVPHSVARWCTSRSC
jgi:NitT/TauT family transport system ATP-binding protein